MGQYWGAPNAPFFRMRRPSVSKRIGGCVSMAAFLMNTLAQDIRYALRTFVKNLGFALAAVLSLAIGIGANTSIFSVANALLLQPLPYADGERLVILWNRSPGLNITEDWFSTAQYL